MNLLTFVFIGGLACWRLASLVANEPGPFGCFTRTREAAEKLDSTSRLFQASKLAEGLKCEWCNSVWFGTALTILYKPSEPVLYLLLPLALSTVAIVIKYIVQTLEAAKEHFELMNAVGSGGYHPVETPEHFFYDPYSQKHVE